MNNDNQSRNENDQNHANSAWAEIVDQWDRPTLSENSEGDKISNAALAGRINLSPDLLDDLELDGQLRVLGEMRDSQNSFVDTVVAQTHPESNLAKQSRPRLPVLKPSFASETSGPDEEMISASSARDLGASSSATLSRKFPLRGSAALFASLVTTFFIGCFLGSMWWYGPEAETAGLPASNEIVTKSDGSNAIADPSNDLQQDDQELSSTGDADTNRFTAGGALAEQSKDQNLGDGSSVALSEETAKADWNRFLDNPQYASPNSVDAKRVPDSTVGSTPQELNPFGDKKFSEAPKVETMRPEGPSWDERLDWNLALQFQNNGVGSVALNGEPLQAVLLKDNAALLLREISAQLQRRVAFLENRLGSKVNGSISVEGTSYTFDHITKLDETVKKVEQHIAKLNVRLPSVRELMTIRAGYREGIFNNFGNVNSIDLAGKNLGFYTEDEVFTICSVLSTSEAFLRDLAKKRLVWEKKKENRSTVAKRKTCISRKSFVLFTRSGALQLPDPIYSGQSIARIQNLGPPELLSMLQNAPSVDLFRNGEEFQKAKDYVFNNGPPEMKVQLSIDRLDSYMADPLILSPETLLEYAAARVLLIKKLRSLRGQVKNPVDGIAMEPLFDVLAKRTDLQGLPVAMGDECKSGAAEIVDLKQVSNEVGRTIGRFNGGLGSRDMAQNDAFRNLSIKKKVSDCMQDHAENPTSQKLKTIDQILQIDHPRLRLEVLESLRDSGTDAAVELMVNKAKFDLEPEVRNAAIEALAENDVKKPRKSLLEGLDYPWHVVAEHSAEALVRLNDQDAIPSLIDMLDLPHPQYPIESNGMLVQRELVGINHMRNCLLCHAPSISENDSVRGLIPESGKPLSPLYYDSRGGTISFAVRADITYLEQDFSVVQSVKKAKPWPSEQRFDFLVQKKKLTPQEAEKVAIQIGRTPNRNRNAVIFALRELTGETPADNSSNNWRNIMAARKNKVK